MSDRIRNLTHIQTLELEKILNQFEKITGLKLDKQDPFVDLVVMLTHFFNRKFFKIIIFFSILSLLLVLLLTGSVYQLGKAKTQLDLVDDIKKISLNNKVDLKRQLESVKTEKGQNKEIVFRFDDKGNLVKEIIIIENDPKTKASYHTVIFSEKL